MKFYGTIGFWEGDTETSPGIWGPKILEREYTGDVYRFSRRSQNSSGKQNPDLTTSNQISILADLYALQNWASVRYVIWNGVRWSVTNVDINYPRITLELGGVYNGAEPPRSS